MAIRLIYGLEKEQNYFANSVHFISLQALSCTRLAGLPEKAPVKALVSCQAKYDG
ncbi:MAG: hypothetical protein ACQES1_06580 [Bacteroidota bacterium]